MKRSPIWIHAGVSGIAALLLFSGCSIKAPEVRVTGEMTALEKEVIGTYRQIEEDTWMVASTRSSADRKTKISEEKKQVLDARRRQQFNQDDLNEFKRNGLVGENNQGFVEIRESSPDTARSELVRTIVSEENTDREVIMSRVIELNETLQGAVRENVLGVFASMYQRESPRGTWIQDPDGKWKQKAE